MVFIQNGKYVSEMTYFMSSGT